MPQALNNNRGSVYTGGGGGGGEIKIKIKIAVCYCKRGHIVADTNASLFVHARRICARNTKNCFCFISETFCGPQELLYNSSLVQLKFSSAEP